MLVSRGAARSAPPRAAVAPAKTNALGAALVGRCELPMSLSKPFFRSRHASRLPASAAGPPGGQMLVSLVCDDD